MTSNWHVHFLSLFVTCYKCFIACKVGSAATGKIKTFTDTILGLLLFLAEIKHINFVMRLPWDEILKIPFVWKLCNFVTIQ